MKTQTIKAMELSMKGYTVEEIASSLMLIFNMHYKKAKEVASKGSWLSSPQGNQ